MGTNAAALLAVAAACACAGNGPGTRAPVPGVDVPRPRGRVPHGPHRLLALRGGGVGGAFTIPSVAWCCARAATSRHAPDTAEGCIAEAMPRAMSRVPGPKLLGHTPVPLSRTQNWLQATTFDGSEVPPASSARAQGRSVSGGRAGGGGCATAKG
jgi:hypothetical protein